MRSCMWQLMKGLHRMAWVRILTGCVVDGAAVKAGALVQVSASDADLLIRMGRAVAEDAPAPPPAAAVAPAGRKAVKRTTRTKRTTRKKK